MNKEQIVDALLEINYKLRSCEEALMLVLEKHDSNVVLEKETDQQILKNPPITSLEGTDLILQRLDCIEDMIKCLSTELAVEATLDMVKVLKITGSQL